MKYITLTKTNIESEHICCAFSDKKCANSYDLKKQWLYNEFDNGYVFQRLDERAKVFIEYGPAEKAWVPVTAHNYMMIGCFWVSGKYKGNGHGKYLLDQLIKESKKEGKDGVLAIVGTKKRHFMTDGKWLLRQGFTVCDTLPSGFNLLVKEFKQSRIKPHFNRSAHMGACSTEKGICVYYTNRCPYSEYHVKNSLVETASVRNMPLKVIKLKTMKKAQAAPTPATIFSLFVDGKFITTDISVCMDSRFDKIVKS